MHKLECYARVITATIQSPDGESAVVYGLETSAGRWVDLSTNRKAVEALAQKLQRLAPSKWHIAEIVEDFVVEECSQP